MAEITATVRPTREEVVPSRKRVKLPAWLEVAKPRLIPLLLATTLGGMALSEGWPLSSPRLVCTLGGGALASAAAGVLNALPSGRLSPTSAFIGAIACTLAAAMLLVSGVNCLAAGLSLLGLCSYVLLYTALLKPYTALLKPRTSQNIVIGGVAGAIPPLVGAAAATGHVGLGGWWLFALVMVWTPAHFWALALLLREDYRAVGIPMLPVVKGPVVTARAIKTYGWITVFLSGLGVFALPSGGAFYGVMLLPYNARLLQLVDRLSLDPDSLVNAKALFRWSILYLFGVCLLLILSRTDLASGFTHQVIQLLSLPTGVH